MISTKRRTFKHIGDVFLTYFHKKNVIIKYSITTTTQLFITGINATTNQFTTGHII